MSIVSNFRIFKSFRLICHQFRYINNSSFIFNNNNNNNNEKLTDVATFIAINLRNKQLLRISGPGSFIYLQSLLTNDMRKLISSKNLGQPPSSSYCENQSTSIIYSFILSAVGRVLCDLFVYRIRYINDNNNYHNDEFILEVDKNLGKAIQRLLLGYNVNKNINVELINDFNLWAIFPITLFDNHFHNDENVDHSPLQSIDSDDLKLLPDPRIGCEHFGYRFLIRLGGTSIKDLGPYIKCQSNYNRIRIIEGHLSDYIRLKYQIGLAEGHNDILSGHYYPFEMNGDFIGAISLDKGLYTSEEKTIKIYSNQPIKQRVFPVEFLCSNNILRRLSPAPRTLIYSTKNQKKIGQLHRRIGRFGIASLFVPFTNNNENILNQDLYHIDTGLKIRASIPKWWPENFNQIYLNPPKYPECLFNFNDENSHIQSN